MMGVGVISQGEREDILKAIQIAERWGYGNLIAHLGSAWAKKLMQSCGGVPGLDEATALDHASNRVPYSIEMHNALLDLSNNG